MPLAWDSLVMGGGYRNQSVCPFVTSSPEVGPVIATFSSAMVRLDGDLGGWCRSMLGSLVKRDFVCAYRFLAFEAGLEVSVWFDDDDVFCCF